MRALSKPDDRTRLEELYRIALQRSPNLKDREAASAFLEKYSKTLSDTLPVDRPKVAWSALARIVLAMNEFLYLD